MESNSLQHSTEINEASSDVHSLREEQYTKARDYHQTLAIQIPELGQSLNKNTQHANPTVTYVSRDKRSEGKENYSKNMLNVNPNASYMKPKRQINVLTQMKYCH